MNKLMTVVAASVCAVSLSGSAVAAEDQVAENKGDEVLKEEEDSSSFEAGFDFDFFSAYVWRNAVQVDRMVMQPCVWADYTGLDPFWFGFTLWQNYSLTDRRRAVYKHALDETDYNLHAGATVWSNGAEDDAEAASLDLELGHEWYTYHGVRSAEKSGYCDTRELYLKATFNNPFVGVYGQASWMYDDFGDYSSGLHYEIGFNKEVDLVADVLTLGADWNVSFADEDYTEFLFGTDARGFGGTTLKFYLNWSVTDWMQLGGTVAYTSVLNDSSRDQLDGTGYDRDYIWGGISLRLKF